MDVESIEQATADYRAASATERGTMFNDKGALIFSQEEHTKRLPDYEQRQAQHLARFRQRLDREKASAQEVIDTADRKLRALNLDPLDHLSADELQIAAAKRIFIQEDVERLTPTDLTARIIAVAESGDRVSAALYARYASARASELTSSGGMQAATAMRVALDQLDQALISPKAKAERQQLHKRKAEAEQVLNAARTAFLNADPAGHEELSRRWGLTYQTA